MPTVNLGQVAAFIKSVTAKKLAEGAAPTVENKGTESNAKLEFGLPEVIAKSHNIPRLVPKDITSYVTDGTLWKRLAGTDGFSLHEDIYVGDYIKMSRPITVKGSYDGTHGSQYVTIAGISTLKGNGDTISMDYEHLVMVPGQGFGGTQHFGRQRMNPASDTTGGYKASEMNTTHLGSVASAGSTDADATINQQLYAEFGTHLKTTRELVSNSVDKNSSQNRYPGQSGASNSWEWISAQAILMSEIECYGSVAFSSSGFDTGNANHWLPLFQFSNSARNNKTAYYWLKDVASSARFCFAGSDGDSNSGSASDADGFVRPRFVIA